MPESALTAPKEKKLSGRQWFESGRASAVTFLFSSPGCILKHWCHLIFYVPHARTEISNDRVFHVNTSFIKRLISS